MVAARSEEEAVAEVRGDPPDLVLIDQRFNGRGGLHVLARLKEAAPEIPMVVVASSEAPDDVRDAIRAGASGYVTKSTSRRVLKHALRLVMSDQCLVPLPAAYAAACAGVRPAAAAPRALPAVDHADGRLSSLTERETSVLRLMSKGMSNKEIARSLGVFEGTVKVHVKAVFRKLGAKNRTTAALIAIAGAYGDVGH